jgi:ribulose 1,5-bisphosphate carboxylase large subunit-like protein
MAITASLGSRVLPENGDSSRLRAVVSKIIGHDKYNDGGIVTIAYPIVSCGLHEGISQLLATILYITGYSYYRSIRLTNLDLPTKFLECCTSPRFGVLGIREKIEEKNRPLLAFTLKPRGAKLSHYTKAAYSACKGGADFVFDDELLADPRGTELEFGKRVPAIKAAVEKAENDSGRKKMYVTNIIGKIDQMEKLVDDAIRYGVDGILLNAFAMGFVAAEEIVRKVDGRVPVFMNKIGASALSSGSVSGIDEAIICKFCRLIGGDAVYTGSFSGDVWWTKSRVEYALQTLRNPLGNIKPSFSVATGMLTIKNLFQNMRIQRLDSIFLVGRGIYEYPGGIEKGAESMMKIVKELSPDMSNKQAKEKFEKLINDDPNIKNGCREFHFDLDTDTSVI